MYRRLSAWEATAHGLLHRFHLDRIRIKLLVFALVASLIPSLTMSYHSYSMNREHVNAKISEELRNASTQTAREFNLWLKERFYETRVFSASYEVTENLEQLGRGRDAGRQATEATRRTREGCGTEGGRSVASARAVTALACAAARTSRTLWGSGRRTGSRCRQAASTGAMSGETPPRSGSLCSTR